MARLAELPYGKLTDLLTKLSNAGLTVERVGKLASSPGLLRGVVNLVDTYVDPIIGTRWGPIRLIKLTTEWKAAAPNVRVKKNEGSDSLTYQVYSSRYGWSESFETPVTTEWSDVSPGLRLRQPSDIPDHIEFRYKV